MNNIIKLVVNPGYMKLLEAVKHAEAIGSPIYLDWRDTRWPEVQTNLEKLAKHPAVFEFIDHYAEALVERLLMFLESKEPEDQETAGQLPVDILEELYAQAQSIEEYLNEQRE